MRDYRERAGLGGGTQGDTDRQRKRHWAETKTESGEERRGGEDEELMMMILTVKMKTFSGSVCGWFHGFRRLIFCRIGM